MCTNYSSTQDPSLTRCLTPYSSTVIGKLLDAVNAWWGFTSAADRQHMEALVKRDVRSGLRAAETRNLTELIESSDNALFNRVLRNQDHILFPLLVSV